MKFLKGLLITVCVVLVIAVVGGYIFLKNFDVNQYKGQITSAASTQLGRTVTIDKIGLNFSLIQGLYLDVRGVSVSDDAQFSAEPFARLKSVNLNLDVMTLITKREILVSKVVVDSPVINLIRDSRGVINAQTIGATASAPATSTATTTNDSKPAANAAVTMPKLLIQSIQLVEGEIIFVDQSQKPAMKITIEKIAAEVNGFSLSESFPFSGQLAVFSNPPNVFIKGKVRLDVSKPEVHVSNLEVSSDLNTINLKSLVDSIPALAAAGLKDKFDGRLTIQVPDLTAGAKGLDSLTITGKLKDGKVVTALLPVAVEHIEADFTADAKDFYIPSFALEIISGKVTGSSKISDYALTQGLNVDVKFSELPLAGLVANLPEGMKLSGGLNGKLTLSGQNLAKPDAFMATLTGAGAFDVKDGKIENLNIVKMLLSRIDFIPGLASLLESGMPEKYQADYAKNVTIFQTLSSSVKIDAGTIDLPDMKVVSDLFDADMQIQADTKLNGKVSGEVVLPQDFSQYLAKKAEPLAYLANSDGRIVIPLTSFEGPLAKLKIMPNVKNLAKNAVMGEASKQLGNLLDKALKTEGSNGVPASSGQEPAPEKQLIDGVLNKIFK